MVHPTLTLCPKSYGLASPRSERCQWIYTSGRLGISHGDPRTVSTSGSLVAPSYAAIWRAFPSPQPRYMRDAGGMRRRSELRVIVCRGSPMTIDNTPIIAMRVAPALHGDDRHATPSLPTPSSQSPHVAQAQGRSKPALSRPRLSVLVRPKGHGPLQGTTAIVFMPWMWQPAQV
jgi:hypothetical protein